MKIGHKQRERDYIFLELTRSICPVCKTTLDAQIRVKDNKVFMFKSCPAHGEFESLISSDIQMYQHSLVFNKPGQMPAEFGSEVKSGCPDDCGICPNHQQHTCIALMEIIQGCNLCCAGCYAKQSVNAKPLDLETIDFMLNQYVKYEQEPEVLQISGGEPTLHADLLKIIDLAHAKKIRHIMLNTNGIRLVEDKLLARELSRLNIELYLQFDGFEEKAYEKLRGNAGLLKLKLQALETCAEYRIPTTLVTTLESGVNDGQMGEIINYAVKNRFIRGITFQPIIYLNGQNFDPLNRLTLPDVIKGIEQQTKNLFKVTDFVPLPCSYPTCCSLTYAFIRNDEVIPVTRKVEVEKYLDYLCNRIIISPASILRKSLEGLWSASASLSAKQILKDFSCVCGIPFTLGAMENLKNNALRIMVKPFMDAYTFDFKRAMKCCVHVLRPDGKMIPFCVYNNIYRGKR